MSRKTRRFTTAEHDCSTLTALVTASCDLSDRDRFNGFVKIAFLAAFSMLHNLFEHEQMHQAKKQSRIYRDQTNVLRNHFANLVSAVFHAGVVHVAVSAVVRRRLVSRVGDFE